MCVIGYVFVLGYLDGKITFINTIICKLKYVGQLCICAVYSTSLLFAAKKVSTPPILAIFYVAEQCSLS